MLLSVVINLYNGESSFSEIMLILVI